MILRTLSLCLLAIAVAMTRPSESLGVSVSEVDNFNVDLEGWVTGAAAIPNPITRETTGGPAGAGDAFLKYNASPSPGKLVAFNQTQWAGNYAAAGITSISMSLKNLGNTTLAMRLAFGTNDYPNGGGVWFVSTVPIMLPGMSSWTDVSFPIDSSALTDAMVEEGGYTFAMSNVATLRLLHNDEDASPKGSNLSDPHIVGVDNIAAHGAAAAIPGDFNGSNKVNAADLAKWRGDFGLSAGSNADGDADSDGNDFLIWQRHLGEGNGSSVAGAATVVPEPATASLAIVAALAAAARRFRTRGRW